jgi:hypothetical protein
MAYIPEIMFVISGAGFLFIYGRRAIPLLLLLFLVGILNEFLKSVISSEIIRVLLVLSFFFVGFTFCVKFYKRNKKP